MSVYNSLKEALKNKEDVTSLDLSAQGLNTFPFEIYEFPNLKELDLSNNKIRIISNSRIFGRDRRYNTTFRLSSLDLSNNRICKIDWYILRCMGLESLNLNNNFISVDYEEILPMYSAGQIMDIPKISLSNNLIYGNFRFCVRQTEVDLSNNFLSGSCSSLFRSPFDTTPNSMYLSSASSNVLSCLSALSTTLCSLCIRLSNLSTLT